MSSADAAQPGQAGGADGTQRPEENVQPLPDQLVEPLVRVQASSGVGH